LLLLTNDGGSPAELAAWLTARGYGDSSLTVLERLGGAAERRLDAQAADWGDAQVDDLNTIALTLKPAALISALATVPGLPDDAFHHDGQLTKRAVRAATLSALGPWPGALLWDVGAGCGSIAIEWARAGGRAVALERNAARIDLIARNCADLGVPDTLVVKGDALDWISAAGQQPPDAIFVGGGVSERALLDACWTGLKQGGRLVANGVTAEAEAVLLAWREHRGGELTRLSVSHLAPVGRFHTWHPAMPVTQYCGVKP
jgi:precorrin-6Y C5,15-methyltransferase (decarboxylating)